MTISNERLLDIVVQVAREEFGDRVFGRRPLMTAVETRVRELGAWTAEDDVLSSSVGMKSQGLANIDWAISHLKERQRLLNLQRDKWRVP
jgi:hypothetical protein